MDRIIVALDVPSATAAFGMIDRLGEAVSFYKVGSPLFTRCGPDIIRELKQRKKRVFLDLKYHDIPNTVASAVESAATLDVDLLTVHANGGGNMIRAAKNAAGENGPRILAVTILTSFGIDDVEQVWGKQLNSLREEVTRLATLAVDAGADGVVASPLEVEALKRRHGAGFLVVTPGIRPAGGDAGDQVRTASAGAAVRSGADYIVVGRPVLEAADPKAVVMQMHDDIASQAVEL
ncbi:MAG TPA: orotidine-5'-phosphate decarboxylase [Longimicrobiales bacterium]|nr:orotidine-5'-phosphate decarboxylase [Longimicrobiales bacterium]